MAESHLNHNYQLPVCQSIWEPVLLKSSHTRKKVYQSISFRFLVANRKWSRLRHLRNMKGNIPDLTVMGSNPGALVEINVYST